MRDVANRSLVDSMHSGLLADYRSKYISIT